MQFACVTGVTTVGAIAERGHLLPARVFIFLWATLVCCPIARWAWNPNGGGFTCDVIDYAGGRACRE
jgi:ammonium transporter, Amt family